MKLLSKTFAFGVGSLLALTGVQSSGAGEPTSSANSGDVNSASHEFDEASPRVSLLELDKVDGTFLFSQEKVATNTEIAKRIGGMAQYLCNGMSLTNFQSGKDAQTWVLKVEGAVQNPFSATIQELAETQEVKSMLMGCACAGNPADGSASANALVKGVSVLTLLGIAQPDVNVNTISFISADGYTVELPVSYIKTHYCPLVFDINGSPLDQSVGGVNQLWLGSTAAQYFARDISTIKLEYRETPPSSPHTDEERDSYINLPQISIDAGRVQS